MRHYSMIAFVTILVLASFLTIGFFLHLNKKSNITLPQGNQSSSQTGGDGIWVTSKDGWEVRGTPPECPIPLVLTTPVDLALVTTILYPGQTRGGDYKAHGGFRFDSSKNDEIIVKAPMYAVVSDASRYIEQGEVQYMFDFQTPCGIRYRFDHLLVLTPKFAKIADGLPPAKVGDSRTTRVNPPMSVTQGEVIATAIGLKDSRNVFVDWGVYDLRNKNKASQDPNWARQHYTLAQYGICWFDLLSPTAAAKVKTLPPGDSVSGSKSDYCEP